MVMGGKNLNTVSEWQCLIAKSQGITITIMTMKVRMASY